MKRQTRSTATRSVQQQQPAPTGNGSVASKGRPKRGGGEAPASSTPQTPNAVTPKRKGRKAPAATPAGAGTDQPATETAPNANGEEEAAELGQ